MRASVPTLAGVLAALLLLAACKEGTVGPELTGSIEGSVLSYETNEPLPGTSITTSPPTNAIVTDANGAFALENMEAGNYTINARRPDYASNSVTVRVRENQTAQATIFMELDDGEDEEPAPDMAAEITNWWNSTSNDSAFVNVEYRVRNTGTADIAAYEIYFRIAAGAQNFYHEEDGAELRANQVNVRQFEKYIPVAEADSVVIEDFWVE